MSKNNRYITSKNASSYMQAYIPFAKNPHACRPRAPLTEKNCNLALQIMVAIR